MEKEMIQQIMYAPHQVSFRRVPVPPVRSGQVRVRVKMIGICGSDIHVFHGTHPFTSYPVTQGHELSAEIVEIGENVSGLSLGQMVTIEPQVVCGECYPCRHGKYNLCEKLKVMGFQTTGAASTYFVVDAARVTPLPEGMDEKSGAMIEPLAVAVHAVRRAGEIRGMNIAVLGAGPIGNLVAQVAKGLGAGSVLITDVSDHRLALAKAVGIDFAVNTKAHDFGAAMVEHFGPDKADVIYDCAGNDTSIGQAIQYARKGSTIILVAVFAGMAQTDLAVLNDHELDLNTSMMYRHEDYLTAIELVDQGMVDLAPLQSRVFPFSRYQQAYEYINANRESTMKVLIDVQDDADMDI